MSFEVYEPNAFNFPEALSEGEVAIDKVGNVTLRKADLDSVGISDQAVVMVDKDTKRVAIRAPQGNKDVKTLSVHTVKRKGGSATDRRKVYLSGAMRRLGLEGSHLKGRRELMIKGDVSDGLLIINLVDLSDRT